MPSKSMVRSVFVYLGLGVLALGLAVSAQAAKTKTNATPSIDGTYRFVYRELPDGTKQVPPDVVGVNDFHHGVRNFNIYWHDAKGKRFSISYIANYKFDGKEYSEKSLYMMSDDEIDGKGINYDLTGPSGMSKVTVKGARISFQLPNYGEPAVVFDGNTFTATRPGAFVDHWEKVK